MALTCPAVLAGLGGDLCQAVSHYCERTSDALTAEPVNAISNVAFLISAVAAHRLLATASRGSVPELARLLPVLIAIVGAGSFVFHTFAMRWAEWADTIPILLFVLVYFWCFLGQFFGWRAPLKAVACLMLLGSTLYAEAAVPGDVLWGGAMYVPLIVAMLMSGLALLFTRSSAAASFLICTGLFLVSFAGRTLDQPLCGVFPLGTHFVWHVCNALILFLLVRTLAIGLAEGERAVAAGRVELQA